MKASVLTIRSSLRITRNLRAVLDIKKNNKKKSILKMFLISFGNKPQFPYKKIKCIPKNWLLLAFTSGGLKVERGWQFQKQGIFHAHATSGNWQRKAASACLFLPTHGVAFPSYVWIPSSWHQWPSFNGLESGEGWGFSSESCNCEL